MNRPAEIYEVRKTAASKYAAFPAYLFISLMFLRAPHRNMQSNDAAIIKLKIALY